MAGDKPGRDSIIPEEKWAEIKRDFIERGMSQSQLLDKYNCPRSTLESRCSGQGWLKLRKEWNDAQKSQVKQVFDEKIIKTSSDLMGLIGERIKHLKKETGEITGVEIRSLQSALNAQVESQYRILGIPMPKLIIQDEREKSTIEELIDELQETLNMKVTDFASVEQSDNGADNGQGD